MYGGPQVHDGGPNLLVIWGRGRPNRMGAPKFYDTSSRYDHLCHANIITVEPLYNGHFGTSHFWVILLLYKGFPLSEVKMY